MNKGTVLANLAPLFDLSCLDGQLHDPANSLVLAANRRLAAKINQAYQYRAAQQGCALLIPEVVSLADCLAEQYQRAVLRGDLAPRRIMPANMERWLWREAVESAQDETTALLKTDSAAQTARSAYQLAIQYHLDDADLNPHLRQWRDHYIARCEQLSVIDSAKAEALAIDTLLQRSPEKPCYIIGFEAMPAMYQALLEHWRVQTVMFTPRVQQQALYSFDNSESELRAAIDAAVRFIERYPDKRFAIVDPSLSQRRDLVERLLLQRMDPQANSVAAERHVVRANISAGQRAADAPLLAIIPELLQLWLENMDMDTLYALCHTPFIVAADSEAFLRSRFYQEVLKRGRPQNGQAYLREKAQSICPELAARWQALAEQARRLHLQRQTYSVGQWCDFCETALASLGWPGQRETDSVEYQQLVLWQDMLVQIKQLPAEYSLDVRGFIALLRDELNHSLFQAEVEDAGIQVLGSLEAASLNFDRLWVVSMSDGNMPARAKPNPLLSLERQRALDMPHCDAGRELRFAQRLLASFRASSPQIRFSYARFEGDIALRPSPLLEGLTAEERQYNAPSVSAIELEWFEDEWAPPVNDASIITGGASLLGDQAACPFKAFATHRLGLRRIDPVSSAMPAHVRGTAVHDALEVLLPTGLLQSQLDQHAQDKLQQAIDAALDSMARKRPDIMQPRYKQLEAQRIRELLLEWLDLEQQRPPFTVQATELPCETEFAGLPLTLRIDRIDALSANRLMVIDYKTGSASISRWQDERPSDPQLLLYALLIDDGRVQALAKAAVKHGEIGFKGISCNDMQMAGIDAVKGEEGIPQEQVWHDQKARWHDRLEALASEFMAGDAQVLPTSDASCQYCHLQDVCRIGERR